MSEPLFAITNGDGRALGRMTIADPLGWVEMPFASVYVLADALQIAGRYDGVFVTPLTELR